MTAHIHLKNTALLLIMAFFATLPQGAGSRQEVFVKPGLDIPGNIDQWIIDGSGSWRISGGKLVLEKAGVPSGPIRRPAALAILRTGCFQRVTVEADIRSTASVQVARRDLDVVVGYESPARFYYVHLSGVSDSVHNGIFLVNNAHRRRIDSGNGKPQLTDSLAHHVRVVRDGRSGRIAVFVDASGVPVMEATDSTITCGKVGFGSFDDTGEFSGIAVAAVPGLFSDAGAQVHPVAATRTVLLFIVDGLQSDAARTAMENGASNMKSFCDNGVWVEEAYCSSPSGRLYLPDNSTPWGSASPPNVAMHTGTHVFESRQMDDVFLAARRSDIVSLFSGNAENYRVFDTPDYCYAASTTDSLVVDFAVEHIRKDKARLLSLHIQETRRNWTGPDDKLKPDSRYQRYLLQVDRLLGRIVRALKEESMWDSTLVIVSSDHGMGMTVKSDHPASAISSWQIFMNFSGPGIKRGKHIAYAETPDIALIIAHFLGLPPLQGHTDPAVSVVPRGVTGTLLTNVFEGNPDEIDHPQFIRRYLEGRNWKPADDYAEYREGMLSLLKTHVQKR